MHLLPGETETHTADKKTKGEQVDQQDLGMLAFWTREVMKAQRS